MMKKVIKYFGLSLFICTLLITETSAKVLPVPHTLQAPYSDWRQPWQDACEEAVIIIADRYYADFTGERIPKQYAHDAILRIVSIENNFFGFNKDTNAEQIIEIINNFFPWEAHIVENPTLENIKTEIDANRPVIVPFYGKAVHNPYFLNGGPDYHTAIIKGYDDEKQEFITQEPGIGRGLDYRYSYDTLMNAIHDFLPNNKTKFGKKVAIFTKKQIVESVNLDGDNDGLSKSEEIKYGTILWLQDSDGDGFSDGDEVKNGFSPTVDENKLPNNSLIKTKDNSKVYLLKNKKRQHIISEQVFLKHGWKWTQIRIVSDSFVNLLEKGNVIND